MSCRCMTRTSQQECRGILEKEEIAVRDMLPLKLAVTRYQILRQEAGTDCEEPFDLS